MKQQRLYPGWLAVSLVGLMALAGTLAAKSPLDHELYTVWNRIEAHGISRDGQWAWWRQAPEQADGLLVVRATDGANEYRFEQGADAVFSHDSQHLVLLVRPRFAEARQARLDKLSEEERPKAELIILALDDGQQQRFERVRSFALPAEASGWVALLHGHEVDGEASEDTAVEDRSREGAEASEPGEPELAEHRLGEEVLAEPELSEEEQLEQETSEEAGEEEQPDEPGGRDDKQKPGTRLVVLSLDGQQRHAFDYIAEYAWSDDGRHLAMTRISPDGQDDALLLFDTRSGETLRLIEGVGHYARPVFSSDGDQLAILVHLDAKERPDHSWSLYLWQGESSARLLADENSGFLPDGWHVSEFGKPRFSDSGRRLYFGSAPAPIEIPDNDDLLDDEVVKVDIWHWQDHELQPMQQVRLEQERKRSYLAVAHLEQDRLVQLATPEVPEVEVDTDGDARYALGIADRAYRIEISWDFPAFFDAWRVDLETGRSEQILTRVQDRPQLSPRGRYAGWWDRDAETWMAIDLAERRTIDLGQAIDTPLADHRNDRPFAANAYVPLLWLNDDSAVLIHDRHDVWRVDPDGAGQARRISAGLGQERGWNIRTLDYDHSEPGLDPELPLLARVFDERSKSAGFYRLYLRGDAPLELVFSEHHYQLLGKAEDAERLLFTRESFEEFPNIRASDLRFSDPVQLSDANPQQADYRWGQVELLEWSGETGFDYQGLLFKPEDFDPERSYPMIVYFYERDSDGLHRHRAPMAHRSVIIPTFYTSNDYIVFVPDTWYREGYPGDSAMEAIMPMTKQLAAEPWVDAERVGIQGHSWAGYKIAYMVTQTDFFRAAAGGAPVGNMVSAYGGIRWQTGMSRMFQYERTQSRLGKTLWEAPELYLHNSPIFMLDQVNTPLLMMHNDQDGAVPWEQGIELFVALRRLGKPAWLVNYNNEPHWPTTFANRKDWQIRMQQYFDHYLKDAPAPRWLSEGIPAIEKGSTLGYESD